MRSDEFARTCIVFAISGIWSKPEKSKATTSRGSKTFAVATIFLASSTAKSCALHLTAAPKKRDPKSAIKQAISEILTGRAREVHFGRRWRGDLRTKRDA